VAVHAEETLEFVEAAESIKILKYNPRILEDISFVLEVVCLTNHSLQ
jgi:hypothetical protein